MFKYNYYIYRIFCDLQLTALVPASRAWGWPKNHPGCWSGIWSHLSYLFFTYECRFVFCLWESEWIPKKNLKWTCVSAKNKTYLFHRFFWGQQRNYCQKKTWHIHQWLLHQFMKNLSSKPSVYHSNNGSSVSISLVSSTDAASGGMSDCTSFNKVLSKSSPPNLLTGFKGSTPKTFWKPWASSRSCCDLSQPLKPCLPEPQQRQRWKYLQEHEVDWHPLLLKDMQKFRAWLRSIWSLLQVWMAKDAMKLGKGWPNHKIRWFLMISPPLRNGSFQKSWSSSRSKSIWYDMASKFMKYSYNWGYSANLSFVRSSWKARNCQRTGALVGWMFFFKKKNLKQVSSGCFRKCTDFLTTSYSEKRPNDNPWKSSHKETWHEMSMAIPRKRIRSWSNQQTKHIFFSIITYHLCPYIYHL